jgi:glucose/arabinose dehydrogenase
MTRRPGMRAWVVLGLGALLGGCESEPPATTQSPRCDSESTGLKVPAGFCVQVVADNLGAIRHLAVAGPGRLYVAVRHRQLNLGGLLALGDGDGDGRYESIDAFGSEGGVGVTVQPPWLYFAADTRVLRYPLPESDAAAVPTAPPEVWITGLGSAALDHGAAAMAVDPAAGYMYLAVGTASNACQPEERQMEAPGIHPCPRLEREAGIWRVPLDAAPGDLLDRAERWVSGWRFGLGIDWHPGLQRLITAGHGRDQLHELWPAQYSREDERRLPDEEVHIESGGADHGWPYCFHDTAAGGYRLGPEYAGHPELAATCSGLLPPAALLPAHASPNALAVYTGTQFPADYRGGVFIALHGAYDPALSTVGRSLVFAPRVGDGLGAFTTFAAPEHEPGTSAGAESRYLPTGIAVDRDGSLLLAESAQGRIWRISWIGQAAPGAP